MPFRQSAQGLWITSQLHDIVSIPHHYADNQYLLLMHHMKGLAQEVVASTAADVDTGMRGTHRDVLHALYLVNHKTGESMRRPKGGLF